MANKLHQIFLGFVIAALAIGTSPQSVMRLSPSVDWAEARGQGRAGGFSGGGHSRPSGARTRPSQNRPAASRPAQTRPSRPATAKPSTRPAPTPARPGAGTRPAKPQVGTAPANRPAGARPPGSRPPGARPPGARPPGSRPPGARPPGARPPGARPPGGRPPGYHPPGHRPPGYRPPYYPPPYPRPPHYYWGPYSYNSSWGWFFTAAIVGSTLIYVADLPGDQDCQKVEDQGETLYLCDGVLYRSTYYKDEQVYEIVSDPDETASAEPTSVIGLALTDPMTRGTLVRTLQMSLIEAGYETGGSDGVFGSATETALQWFQYDNELDPTGVVDEETAKKLGIEE